MSLERPKILSVITVPTGGWRLDFTMDAGGTPQAVNCTVPAGDYWMAWDAQDDDFLWKLCDLMTDAAQAIGAGPPDYRNTEFRASIDATTHIVTLECSQSPGNVDFTIDWTTNGGPSIGGVLGADVSVSADTSSAGGAAGFRELTLDYHHAYAWYADEDGYLTSKPVFDIPSTTVSQSRVVAGQIKTLQVSSFLYDSGFSLFAITNDKTWSNGVGYTTAPVLGKTRNEPLECWWREAIQGKRFRFYRNDQQTASKAHASATRTGGDTDTATASAAAWTTNEFAGMMLYIDDATGDSRLPARWYIDSNTNDDIEVPNAWGTLNAGASSSSVFYVIDGSYGTYVLNADATTFSPAEEMGIDRFSIGFSMSRYVA